MTPLYGYVRLACCVLADNADDFFLAYGGTRHKADTPPSERKLWKYVSGGIGCAEMCGKRKKKEGKNEQV